MVTPEKQKLPEVKEITPIISIATEASENHPERNEDSTFVLEDQEAAGVFDGMGGGLAGKEASQLASETVRKKLLEIRKGAGIDEWKTAILQALEEAQQKVTAFGNETFFKYLDDPFVEAAYRDRPQKEIEALMEEKKISPTGTTASIVKLLERPDGGADMVYGHTGDSRIYVLRKDGKIEQITKDQGALEQAIKSGIITQEEADFIDQATSREEIMKKFGPERGAAISFLYKDLRRGVTGALGISESKFQTGVVRLEPGERVFITSDGIHDNLTKEEIEKIIAQKSGSEATKALIEAAKKRYKEGVLRSKADDKTAVCLEVPEIVEAEEVEEIPTLTPEQVHQYENTINQLKAEAEELKKLLPLARHVEAGRPVLTSREKRQKIAQFGVTGIEDRLQQIMEDITSYEYALAQHKGDTTVMESLKKRYQELQKEKLARLAARDKARSAAEIEKIRKAIGQ